MAAFDVSELEVHADHEDEAALGVVVLTCVVVSFGVMELEVHADHEDDESLSLSLSLSLSSSQLSSWPQLPLPLLDPLEVGAAELEVHADHEDEAATVVGVVTATVVVSISLDEVGCGALEVEVQADHADDDDEPVLSSSWLPSSLSLSLLELLEEVAATMELVVQAVQEDEAATVVVGAWAWLEEGCSCAPLSPRLTTPAVADVAKRAKVAVEYFILILVESANNTIPQKISRNEGNKGLNEGALV